MTFRAFVRPAICLVCASVLSALIGCAGGGVTSKTLEDIVVQPDDVPAVYELVEQSGSDEENSFSITYQVSSATFSKTIECRVTRLSSASEAQEFVLSEARELLTGEEPYEEFGVEHVGDLTIQLQSTGDDTFSFIALFSSGDTAGSVTLTGSPEVTSRVEALVLARIMLSHMTDGPSP